MIREVDFLNVFVFKINIFTKYKKSYNKGNIESYNNIHTYKYLAMLKLT